MPYSLNSPNSVLKGFSFSSLNSPNPVLKGSCFSVALPPGRELAHPDPSLERKREHQHHQHPPTNATATARFNTEFLEFKEFSVPYLLNSPNSVLNALPLYSVNSPNSVLKELLSGRAPSEQPDGVDGLESEQKRPRQDEGPTAGCSRATQRGHRVPSGTPH